MNVINIELDSIDSDIEQSRKYYDQESIANLVQSIKEIGLQSPIKVTQVENDRYRIIFGHRRYNACKLLGLKTIAAIISENDNEQDIFFQQLAENIQRESLLPIEEAEAFKKALENEEWSISIKYLSGKLGKTEKYISNKLSLLNFGTSVQNIIHNNTEILPGKLSEQQLLPLKALPIEYRDAIALKVAFEQVPVNDVKKISVLFSSEEIDPASKESLLNYDHYKLLQVYADYDAELQQRLKIENEKPKPIKPRILSDKESVYEDDIIILEKSPIEEKVAFLLNRIPPAFPITEKDILSYKELNLEKRKELIENIDCIIENLEGHLEQLIRIKDMVHKDRVQLIK